MKRQLLNIIVFVSLLLPIKLFAQPASSADQDITGLWKGSLYNDTTKKNLPYEIAISEEKGKLTGYSYTEFDIDGKKEVGVKRVKIKRKDGQLIIEDVELISNNYSEPPPRKVRQMSVVQLLVNDTVLQLTGNWSTNPTKEYRPLTGNIQLQRINDYPPLALYKKLVDLKLEKDLSFVKTGNDSGADMVVNNNPSNEIKSTAVVVTKSSVSDKSKETTAPLPEKKTEVAVENKPVAKEMKTTGDPDAKVADKEAQVQSQVAGKKTTNQNVKDSAALKVSSTGELVKNPVDKPATTTSLSTTEKKKEIAVADAGKIENKQPITDKPATSSPSPVTKKTQPLAVGKEPAKKEVKPSDEIAGKVITTGKPAAVTTAVVENKTPPVATAKETVKTGNQTITSPVIPPEPKKELPLVKAAPVIVAAANVKERKMSNEQSVFFESDSLLLTLYDNGDVDGDTVSVLMNGQIIFAKQGLSTKANSKTIYLDKGMPDTLSMVMYAENLGSIPPNTGLLVIMDGEKRYEVRFSADLKTNAAILLRRKPAEK